MENNTKDCTSFHLFCIIYYTLPACVIETNRYMNRFQTAVDGIVVYMKTVQQCLTVTCGTRGRF